MAYRINHIHLKAPDPKKTAEWYVSAFGFKIVGDEVRGFGDRFLRCQSEDGGMMVNISGARTGETLGPGDASAHHGLEHFG
ncbi:MAG: VOC family protein, partial [Candidatus Rokuibacteriota bacterium]